ncbi:hypothetical protein [Paenibacillus prosopidis]|uniref:Uncharacterized protein n=1 Tax=Paenibacillus prosopidis TaxID=630520 RepID=A0A368W139_9BACL|nr:hypothetical protein [Paenibacillus prosopidis]RCW48094.1 hypothetical protein DFP97_107297 [Paenibacillus prosopidis]
MLQVPQGLLRISGWLLLIAGIMGFTGQIVHLEDVPESLGHLPEFLKTAVNTHVLLAYASTFLLLGLTAIFLRQAGKLPKWGWAALPLLFIGLMLEIFHGPVQIIAYPILFGDIETEEQLKVVSDQITNMDPTAFPLSMLVFVPIVPFLMLGLLILGLSTLKARVFPKALGIFTLVVLVVCITGFFFMHLRVFTISFGYIYLLFGAFGAMLAFEKREQPPASFTA